MKRAFLLVVMVTALVTAGPAAAGTFNGSFEDDNGSVHEPDINGIAAVGITLGCGGLNYCPLGSVTRGEMATFLVRALQLAPVATGAFTDIAGNIHAPNINALAQAGITTGCAPAAFCPGEVVSREQMATFLARALDLPPATPAFADVGSGTHAADIGAIAAAGITQGCGPGLFCPFAAVSREQMATFLVRAFEIEPIYPQINVVAGRHPFCTKDGLLCSVNLVIPFRNQYEFREGFYDVGNSGILETGGTRIEMTLNGLPLPTTDLGVVTAGVYRQRTFRAVTGLAPGVHVLVVRWLWNGVLEQTTSVTITIHG